MNPDKAAPSDRRQPKGDKRARTRAALLAAARDLIREKGFEQTTVHDIAQRAGMTSGAVYGNFKDRNDLFMALADAHWAPIVPVVAEGSTFAETMRAFAEATIASLPERRLAAGGRLAGIAYTLSNEALRAHVHEITAKRFDAGAEWLRAVAEQHELSMPPETFVRVLHALTEGLLFQRFLTPELYPDEVFYAAFAVLALSATRVPQPAV